MNTYFAVTMNVAFTIKVILFICIRFSFDLILELEFIFVTFKIQMSQRFIYHIHIRTGVATLETVQEISTIKIQNESRAVIVLKHSANARK